MTNYVTKKQLEQIIYDQNKNGKFICLDDDNKIWTCVKKNNQQTKMYTTSSIVKATEFLTNDERIKRAFMRPLDLTL
ncbi:MAG: hypothetical protein WCR19_04565 [Acholeplasmataceae bacterium]